MHAADDSRERPLAVAAAAVMATVAFAAYSRTLLPGVDLGDTGGFQAAVLWPETSARRAYPLYYLLAEPFVRAVSAGDPARGLNLFSALCAALAIGLLAYLVSRLARSIPAGIAASALLAFSYTFWTQAIIAEVYALHLVLIALCLIALRAFAEQPGTARLALFFAVYAVAFGNHLAMLVLLIPFAVFLLHAHPNRRTLLRPRAIVLAAAIALLAALLYLPNLLSVWTHIDAPPEWSGRVAAFWFDTTKADWREAMVLGVDAVEMRERLAMWIWDARQQFGIAGLVAAGVGALRLWTMSRPWALLVWLAYALSTLFALTYNVGDPHVFLLPGHLLTALAAGIAIARPLPRSAHLALATAIIAYGGWRAWDTWPAVDRHADYRGETLVARLTTGLAESHSVLLSRMEWQSENVLLYSGRYVRRDLAWTRLADVLPHFPFFVRDNRAIGRDIVLTADGVADVIAAYGPLYTIVQDPVPPAPPLTETAARIPLGAPYVLVLLTATREVPLNLPEFEAVLATLSGERASVDHQRAYQVWAGVVGDAPSYYRASDRPFRESFRLLGDVLTVRMDGWVPFDTFRRGGFGSILQGRTRMLTIERGASLVWLSGDNTARTVYSGGLYAPAPRFRIPAFLPQQARGTAGAILGIATLPR